MRNADITQVYKSLSAAQAKLAHTTEFQMTCGDVMTTHKIIKQIEIGQRGSFPGEKQEKGNTVTNWKYG